MSNKEIIEYLEYTRINLNSMNVNSALEKRQALLEAIDLIDSINKCKADVTEIITDFQKHELDSHTKGVCDGLKMALEVMEKHFRRIHNSENI